jgi:hypothetical protein
MGASAPQKATGVEARNTTFHKSGCLELTLAEEHLDDDFWEDDEEQNVQLLLPKSFFQTKGTNSKASYENNAEPNPEMSPTLSSEPNPEMSPCFRSMMSPAGSANGTMPRVIAMCIQPGVTSDVSYDASCTA